MTYAQLISQIQVYAERNGHDPLVIYLTSVDTIDFEAELGRGTGKRSREIAAVGIERAMSHITGIPVHWNSSDTHIS